MLKYLRISNYALIKHVEIDFNKGFSVISGSTGSGKSIMLNAIELLVGGRFDKSSIKSNSLKCIIEGRFILQDKHKIFFIQHDLDFDCHTIIRREINSSGKNRMFVNDTPVLLNVLKDLGSQIIEIHGQNQSIRLTQERYQKDLIDKFSGSTNILRSYRESYHNYLNELSNLKALKNNSGLSSEELDFYKYQYKELSSSNIEIGEKLNLEKDIKDIQDIDKINSSISEFNEIFNSSLGVVELISIARKKISQIRSFTPISERLKSILIDIDDINSELDQIANKFSLQDNYLDIQSRFDLINRLLLKYKKTSEGELIELRDKLLERITFYENLSNSISNQENIVNNKKNNALKLANKLSLKRKSVFKSISRDLIKCLNDLGIKDANFEIISENTDELSAYGIDNIKFLFSANRGTSLKELSKVASGGELSRLMLAIKYISAEFDDIDVLIFDEIDSGVSGEIASLMGEMMQKIGKDKQLFSITHLPQIAAKASHHLNVFKQSESNETVTSIVELKHKERVREIAKLLSGKGISIAATENAKSLLNQ